MTQFTSVPTTKVKANKTHVNNKTDARASGWGPLDEFVFGTLQKTKFYDRHLCIFLEIIPACGFWQGPKFLNSSAIFH